MPTPADPFGFVKRLAVKGDTSWMADGACVDADPEMFFPDSKIAKPHPFVRRMCEECPVRDRCLSYAVETGQCGIWGGTTEHQRDTIRKVRQANRARAIEKVRAEREKAGDAA